MSDDDYFDREYFELHAGKRKYLRFLVRLLARHGVESGPVLDLGSGYGFFLEALAEAGYEPQGLELSPHAAEISGRRVGAPVHTGSAEDPLPYADGAFRAVTLLDVIEHLADYDGTLAECRRTLAPGGILVVITLNAASVARPLLGRRWSWYQDPTHVHMLSLGETTAAVERAGLEVVDRATLFNFCVVGESTPLLRPLRRFGRVVRVPRFGDSLLVVGRRPGGGR